ncbi:hypothetical protein P280DRAFT_525891 [Massarina eburnea CBS 473.64]|uniref:Uncharacterized protein n=1 Tax=Massarina eburnea CBS 473.64 TaxID=1395130 RepID=A0A6A6SGD3_9PLEO|nr:hypothetical protein P280DRAFT_525891 [Massarina eburnea CBS 473.64]
MFSPGPHHHRDRIPALRRRTYDYEELYAETQDISPVSASHFRHSMRSPIEAPSPSANKTPPKDPALLASRAKALFRRCTALTANVSHLSSVIEPLRTIKAGDITDADIRDVAYEAKYVRQAFAELDSQIDEVTMILGGVKKEEGGVKHMEKEKHENMKWVYERDRVDHRQWR